MATTTTSHLASAATPMSLEKHLNSLNSLYANSQSFLENSCDKVMRITMRCRKHQSMHKLFTHVSQCVWAFAWCWDRRDTSR